MLYWRDTAKTIKTKGKVKKIEFRLVASDVTGDISYTDVLLQGGSVATIWSGHTSELKWSFDT